MKHCRERIYQQVILSNNVNARPRLPSLALDNTQNSEEWATYRGAITDLIFSHSVIVHVYMWVSGLPRRATYIINLHQLFAIIINSTGEQVIC